MADNGLNESVLKELDRVIEEKYSFHVHKEKEIDEIKARLHRSGNNEEKYELCGSLFYLYLHYQADSSLYYINEKMRLLPLLDKPELKNEIIINRAEVMGVMGMYNEALSQFLQRRILFSSRLQINHSSQSQIINLFIHILSHIIHLGQRIIDVCLLPLIRILLQQPIQDNQ